jgi:hypothetical protein
MELGPIQELWLYRLENYPERQTDSELGHLNDDGESYQACCLGEYLITYKRCNKIPFAELWELSNLSDDSDLEVLSGSFIDLGLHDESGEIVGGYTDEKGQNFESLAELNDHGFSWDEIAAIIRERSEDIFTKSI